MLLEVIATTLDDALAAEDGGAGRIELVRDLDRGGLTPTLPVIEAVLARVRIPVRVMVREEEPFVPSRPEVLQEMTARVRELHALPLDGVVVGILDAVGRVDAVALDRVLTGWRSPRVTFHRAFEEARDQHAAIRALATHPAVDTVLTSEGRGTWAERFRRLTAVAAAAANGFRVLAAIGVDAEALDAIDPAWPFDIHVGRAARDPEQNHAPVSVARVRRLASLVG